MATAAAPRAPLNSSGSTNTKSVSARFTLQTLRWTASSSWRWLSSLRNSFPSMSMAWGQVKLSMLAMASPRVYTARSTTRHTSASPCRWAWRMCSMEGSSPTGHRDWRTEAPPRARASMHRAMTARSLEIASRQPWLPQVHWGPLGSITMWPTSPAPTMEPKAVEVLRISGQAMPVWMNR